MNRFFFFLLSLTSILRWADLRPVDLGSLEFDHLDTDIAQLKYEAQHGDLDDFFEPPEKKNSNDRKSQGDSKSKVNVSGFKKNSSDSKGEKIKFDIETFKNFLKEAGLRDIGSYDDGSAFGVAKGSVAAGVGVAGNEERKYKKGAKTRGFHKISHKDEYKKDKEFYEDDETKGVIRKAEGRGIGFSVGGGAGIARGQRRRERLRALGGREGLASSGNTNKIYEGFSDSQGIMAATAFMPTDCLRVIPSSHACCGSSPAAPSVGGGVSPSPQTYDPFQLNSETDPFSSGQKTFEHSLPPPFVSVDDTSAGYRTKAYACSLLPCLLEDTREAVCACNYNTGNVVTFKNSCDVKKHNCRFDTAFNVILNEVCPWEFESRRALKQFAVDYTDPKYYNK